MIFYILIWIESIKKKNPACILNICTNTGEVFLLNFLFQISEQLRMEEVLNRDSQTIAELFDCRNRGAMVSSADDIVYCGLGHTAHATELVDGNTAITA